MGTMRRDVWIERVQGVDEETETAERREGAEEMTR